MEKIKSVKQSGTSQFSTDVPHPLKVPRPSAQKYRLTLQCWDELVNAGYSPFGMSSLLITMHRLAFKYMILHECDGSCAVQYLPNGARISSIWWDAVEISYLEQNSKTWVVEEDWKARE